MDKTKNCGTCTWCKIDELNDMICVNSDSEYVSDYVDKTHCCDDYERHLVSTAR